MGLCGDGAASMGLSASEAGTEPIIAFPVPHHVAVDPARNPL